MFSTLYFCIRNRIWFMLNIGVCIVRNTTSHIWPILVSEYVAPIINRLKFSIELGQSESTTFCASILQIAVSTVVYNGTSWPISPYSLYCCATATGNTYLWVWIIHYLRLAVAQHIVGSSAVTLHNYILVIGSLFLARTF